MNIADRMKMLISPLSRQPSHGTIYQSVSFVNGGWFGGHFLVNNKSATNGIQLVNDEDMKPLFCSTEQGPEVKDQNLNLEDSDSTVPVIALRESPSPKDGEPLKQMDLTDSSLAEKMVECPDRLLKRQQLLESRASGCLKRLRGIKSSTSKRILYSDVRNVVSSLNGEKPLNTERGERLHAENLQSQLSSLAYDGKRIFRDVQSDSDTDYESDMDYAYHELQSPDSITIAERCSPVPIPKSSTLSLEKSAAWKYEQERYDILL